MRAVHNAENFISSFESESHEATILDNVDLVLRVSDDRCLALRDLDDCQPVELDDSVGN